MTKNILWVIIGINTLALIIFICAYFYYGGGQSSQQDTQLEKGWIIVLALTGLLVIGLAAAPLRFGHSTGWLVFSGFFAILPLLIAAIIYIPDMVFSLKKKKTFAEIYYKDKTQRRIATAIETNDTVLLKELIKGQNLDIQGIRVNDWDGLNYLQFAVHLRSNADYLPINKETNLASIRILINSGSPTTAALAEACMCLSPDELLLLLNAGAKPNIPCYIGGYPLLFQVIADHQNDIAILLIQKGADVNALNSEKYTPVMYAAYNAQNTEAWSTVWRLVRYMLEEAHADYTYTTPDGMNLPGIIKKIQKEAKDKKMVMPPDFEAVVKWLESKKALSIAL